MTAADEPVLSILVATRDRAPLLVHLLRSLDVAQRAAAIACEILVADNGSTDDTPAVLAQWAAGVPGRIRLRVDAPGKSRALNAAVRQARAPLLAFTDDDVEVAPNWLAEIVCFFAGHPEYDAAIGRVLPPSGPIDSEIQARIEQYRTIPFFDHGDAVRDEPSLHGADMVVRRTAFDTVGGFNEVLGPGEAGGMEDQELGHRLRRAGMRIGYMPQAIVHHGIEPSRLTPQYFRHAQRIHAHSRLAMDPSGAWRRAWPRLLESSLGFAWWSVLARSTRREHARGRMIQNAEILRVHWQRRRSARRAAPTHTPYRHILLVRTDRLGDMIVTTPLFTAIKQAFPGTRLTVLASAAGAPVARAHPAVDAVEVDPIEARGPRWRGTLALARRLRRLRCDAVVVVHAKHRLAIAAWLAGIPLRIGPGQRGYSLLFNRPVTQHHRRPPIRHETAYSLDLLRPLGIEPDDTARPAWQVAPTDAAAVDQILAAHGLGTAGALATLHPGHGGSSLNWTPQRYAELADCLASEQGMAIVVTGAAADAAIVARVCAAMHTPALNLAGQLSLPQLAALIARSAVYVGSSTGPTHLAAAVKTPVVALYCPLEQSLPDRWRPQGERCVVLLPPVNQVCPTCLGPQCRFYPCMDLITPRTVADAAHDLVEQPTR